MPYYHQSGSIPPKRHTVFKKADGSFYYEQLFGSEGFSGDSALLYHLERPTQVKEIREKIDVRPKIAVEHNVQARKFVGFNLPTEKDFLSARKTVLCNSDVAIALASPSSSMHDYFYKNAMSDECIFVHRGSGILRTMMGEIRFEYGDYLIIPKGVIYQLLFDTTDNRLLIIESNSAIEPPKRYLNKRGQFLESSPYCERDLKLPQHFDPVAGRGDFMVKIKKQGFIHQVVYATHPFDVVGWDGCLYPYAFNIHNFEPITGRIHQPPPVHQTFQGHNYVICSFCPRLYDYHPDAIPAPYNHSNLDSDEVIYYVEGDFMSRNDIDQGYITLHPSGIPHGPHPGAMERSIGKKGTAEFAVMVDPFRPLSITEDGLKLDTGDYFRSWLDDQH
ncbi:homogentisate 1,2-dioxygenase [Persicobacter psychrovividus]|uniref:Homogentisate 1,2-dioxygenase n=1 Tax=Persicobacter psychrovividus TaxID=387638 RepID=A0ABN6LBW2_9BACT|nr:homogentisate 1,2-dioxygenase [Persicobacter psychrovividus]